MITREMLLRRVERLEAEALERWIAEDWVRPVRQAGVPVFAEADVARLRLILDLRDEMEVGEEALPVVLSLIDQLHETRRQMRRLCEALLQAGPEDRARDVLDRLRG
ncbi:chaperone modulator CbpM [Roseomonas sp. OT10]|uniref:chaperone modulator CbpM n=1 Tax=Roseomonas cutis TaxID=2897332 RepID=UPI001E36BDC2|nr:chaperone modulator CbpM [Roseomonas sp. OT10]UFN51233.1 chaperone modulator CbpM [Roseomonas sp. OT10]